MRRSLSLAASLAATAMTAACGFTPLYGVTGVSPGMSSVQVNVPHGRTAFLLGEDLDDAFARNRDAPPVYRLDITVDEKRYPRGLRIDNVANMYETHVTVNYTLVDVATDRVVKTGAEPIEVSYDVADQPYAGVAAQQDSESRAAAQAAARIRIDMAAYFASLAQK